MKKQYKYFITKNNVKKEVSKAEAEEFLAFVYGVYSQVSGFGIVSADYEAGKKALARMKRSKTRGCVSNYGYLDIKTIIK